VLKIVETFGRSLGNSQSSPDPLAAGDWGCCTSPRTPPPLSAFGLTPMNNAGHALVSPIVTAAWLRSLLGYAVVTVTIRLRFDCVSKVI